MNDRQITLGDINSVSQVRGLSENQRKIVSLLNCGLCQADISRKMKVSRPYVCELVKKLESLGLIQAKSIYEKVPGKRSYTKFYSLSPELQARIKGENVAEPFTSCRVHNIRLKIAVISLSAPVSTDKRTNYSKSWTMRGGPRHKYWFMGKAGMPSVTLDVHPKTIVAYVDKKQMIVAKTPDEAQDIGWRAIYMAVDSFIEKQSRFGVQIDVAHTGTVIGKVHGGFVGTDSPAMEEGVRTKNWWIDRSQEAELGPGHPELETDLPEGMTRLDALIKVSERVDLTTIPTAMKEITDKLNPMSTSILQVEAMLQGGISMSVQYQNMLGFMTKVLDEMAAIRKENAELKARLG